ncbi:MAG TPA: GNAT family N-acetyltransferase [Candidatus Limnocylindrales bacterium]|nr:GNAT family N-acetyltransferase [Candidatus Limnocylindrales bacterium]
MDPADAEGHADPADDPSVRVASIPTPRLTLESMSVPFMRALARGDHAGAERAIGAAIPDDMPANLAHFLEYRLGQLEADPTIRHWLARAMVLTGPDGTRRVIGTIGFHGPPDEQGRLEVGYRIEPEYRRRGYTREAVRAMFDWAAAEHDVHSFVASIRPDNAPSLGLAAGFGFVQVGTQIDDIDGLELVFETTWPAPA